MHKRPRAPPQRTLSGSPVEPGGAKIADQVHSGEQQLQFVDVVKTARAEEVTVCHYSSEVRAAGIEDLAT